YIRIFGIISLVWERTAGTYCNNKVFNRLTNHPLCCLSTIIRWMASLILAWPIFIQMDITYILVNEEIMVSIPEQNIRLDVPLAAIVIGTSAVICTACFILILLRIIATPEIV
ncbi:unnamed protein product, partial [Cylicocyclus nassatus]